jgi:cyclophilin family peptidyl-prolyl cis-trans isomerase
MQFFFARTGRADVNDFLDKKYTEFGQRLQKKMIEKPGNGWTDAK